MSPAAGWLPSWRIGQLDRTSHYILDVCTSWCPSLGREKHYGLDRSILVSALTCTENGAESGRGIGDFHAG